MSPLLEVRDLKVSFATEDGIVHASDGINYTVDRGEALGIVGESGSGKSVSALTVIGLTRFQHAEISGEVIFDGRDLLKASDEEMRKIRGNDIAMIFQDPLSSLHPFYKVGRQLVEAIRTHQHMSKHQAKERAIEFLSMVGIPDPKRRFDAYPHEFSGGMRQRAMIAMALVNDPRLLIADEPTTALDVTVQAQILELIAKLQGELGTAVILITHDLGVVAEVTDRIAVMYAGRIVEYADKRDLFRGPEHPYTWGLLQSIPRLDRPRDEELVPIPGRPPSLINRPSGCHFHPRCPYALPRHREIDPRLEPLPDDPAHTVACLLPSETRKRLWQELSAGKQPQEARTEVMEGEEGMSEPLVEVRDLVKHFPITSGIIFQRQVAAVHAVDGVSFDVMRGETLGIVGETGCGKSTTARLITRLLAPTSGTIRFEADDISHLSLGKIKPLRKDMQMIFQDPYSSLNPRKTVGSIIAEPYKIHGLKEGKGERKRAVQDLMEQVGLNPEHYNRYPHEFSGGQRQRIGVARALALQPKLIIADEPVSALDVSIQAQILNLLRELQRDLGITLVVIAHDLSVVRHMCDRVAVMYLGKIVELADSDTLYSQPRHPYTGALMSAVPVPDPELAAARKRRVPGGDVPSPTNPPPACRYHPRCPKAQDICRQEEPLLAPKDGGSLAACHFPLTDAEAAEYIGSAARA